METQLGYMDEKESGAQKPKKPQEIQVRKSLVARPVGKGAERGLAQLGRTQAFPGSQFWLLGLRGTRLGTSRGGASGIEGFKPSAYSLPCLLAEAQFLQPPSLSS